MEGNLGSRGRGIWGAGEGEFGELRSQIHIGGFAASTARLRDVGLVILYYINAY